MKKCGIDTSVFLRLVTGQPRDLALEVESSLRLLRSEWPGLRFQVSSLAVAEAFFALQRHYQVPRARARQAICSVLQSGLVEAAGGEAVLKELAVDVEPGVVDRLIALEHAAAAQIVYTLDRAMSRLPNVRLLAVSQ